MEEEVEEDVGGGRGKRRTMKKIREGRSEKRSVQKMLSL